MCIGALITALLLFSIIYGFIAAFRLRAYLFLCLSLILLLSSVGGCTVLVRNCKYVGNNPAMADLGRNICLPCIILCIALSITAILRERKQNRLAASGKEETPQSELPAIETNLDHVALNVRDLDEAITFLRELLGLELLYRQEAPRQAFVGRAQTVLGLVENKGFDFRAVTMAHLAFHCASPDFPGMVKKIRAMGLSIVTGPKPQRDGETIIFRDPSGNLFEVCYPALPAKAGR